MCELIRCCHSGGKFLEITPLHPANFEDSRITHSPDKFMDVTRKGLDIEAQQVLLREVKSFRGGNGSIRCLHTLAKGATVALEYNDGVPLAAVQRVLLEGGGVRPVVALNFYDPSSRVDPSNLFWDASTDGFRLMLNALELASRVRQRVSER